VIIGLDRGIEVRIFILRFDAFKDKLEKSRLRHRRGSFYSYEDFPGSLAPELDSTCMNDSAGSNFQGRLGKIMAKSEQSLRRELCVVRRAKLLEKKMSLIHGNLNSSNNTLEVNTSGAAYDILNHSYHNTPDGERLRKHDDLLRYRSRLRTMYLSSKNSSGINPITGSLSLNSTSYLAPDSLSN
jgi:hypothetical protein